MSKLVVTAPTGARIVAVAGPAGAAPGIDPGSWCIEPDGSLGYATVDPDPFERPTGEETHTVFLDEDGRTWAEHRLTVRRLVRGRPVGRPLAFTPTRSGASRYLRDLAEAADALRSAVEVWMDDLDRPPGQRDPIAIGEYLGQALADLDHLLPRRDPPHAPAPSGKDQTDDRRPDLEARGAGPGDGERADPGDGERADPGDDAGDGDPARDDRSGGRSRRELDAPSPRHPRSRPRGWRRTDRGPVLRRL